jgi:hypothetical protein
LSWEDSQEWWEGEFNGNVGHFPKSYVEVIPKISLRKKMQKILTNQL